MQGYGHTTADPCLKKRHCFQQGKTSVGDRKGEKKGERISSHGRKEKQKESGKSRGVRKEYFVKPELD
jgi:hypothetical protein